MPLYTVHVKIETDIEVRADSRTEAIELAAQEKLGGFISASNATIVGVCEEPAQVIPDELPQGGNNNEGGKLGHPAGTGAEQ